MEPIIIYGIGQKGSDYYKFLQYKKLDHMVAAFCDKRSYEVKEWFGKPVLSYNQAVKKRLPFLIGVGTNFSDEVRSLFQDNGEILYYDDIFEFARKHLQISMDELNRDLCAYRHIDLMNDYFDDADSEENLNFFWGDTECHKLFLEMDPSNIVELACGRGRHVPKYLPLANHVTLVDVLEKNIDICKNRFKNYDNISYYKNNGYDLSKLQDHTYTALFTYDAMVHFELMDIAKYLSESYRILKVGGMALFHHSNNHTDYRASFVNAPGGRSFMSKDIFAYLSYRAGFEIIEQKIIDWGVPELDCLTLVKKRA